MDKFYIIVLSIFAFFLILILTIIGRTVVSENSTQQFPPVLSKCPDYWDISGDICINPPIKNGLPGLNGKLMTNCGGSYDRYHDDANCNIKPTDTKWSNNNLTPTCNHKNWANMNNIMWDGVSNYNSC
jgi:hypothetical protein